jgi:hypothetical protein
VQRPVVQGGASGQSARSLAVDAASVRAIADVLSKFRPLSLLSFQIDEFGFKIEWQHSPSRCTLCKIIFNASFTRDVHFFLHQLKATCIIQIKVIFICGAQHGCIHYDLMYMYFSGKEIRRALCNVKKCPWGLRNKMRFID